MENRTSSQRLAAAMALTIGKSERGDGNAPFTIGISREYGARGALIAAAIGARLGWAVYDRELLQLVAEGMGLRASLLEGVDERRKGWFAECMEALNSGKEITDTGYARHLVETLISLAVRGHCVVVGRGAPQVLPPATTLRVRFIGDKEDRVEAIRQEFQLSPLEAVRKVDTSDAERNRFVRDHFHKDPADPLGYDLVLNTSRISIPHCAEIVVEALHRMEAQAAAKSAGKKTDKKSVSKVG